MSRWKVVLAGCVSLALLVSSSVAPAAVHVPAAMVVWVLVAALHPVAGRSVGRPERWASVLFVLALLGALVGKADVRLGGLAVSLSGMAAAGTMVSRAMALVLLGVTVSTLVPARELTARLRSPLLRRVVEVVVLASNMVPVLVQAMSDAHGTLRERRPGWRRLPERVKLIAVHSVVRAARLADEVAFDMALAEHNDRGQTPANELGPREKCCSIRSRGGGVER